MSLVVLCKDLVELCVWLVAVHLAALLCHADSTERHESPLQRLVCLETNNLLQILLGTVCKNVARLVGIDTCNNVCVKVKNA